MRPFTVDWNSDAEDELARVWMQASDPAAVNRAEVEADRLLAGDPIRNGQELSEGLYCIHVPPLIVNYTVDVARRHVEVTWVRLSPWWGGTLLTLDRPPRVTARCERS
jgi:hypothetical protein